MEDKRQRSRTKSPSRKTSSDKLSAKPQKRRRLDGFQDEESPCTSTDTGRVFFFEGDQPKRRRTTVSHDDQNKSKWETSRDREEPSAKKRRPLDVFLVDGESPSTSADTDADEPGRKKRRYFSDLEVTNEDTGDDSALIAAFEAQYVQQNPLGEGGCGSVYAGYRKADLLPVAIKYVPKDKIFCKHRDKNGKLISVEVAIMKRLGGGSAGSAGKSAPVALLDFYDLQQQLILVLERPVPAQDLLQYIMENGGCLEEEEAKIITKQLVDAAIHLLENRIFHRDIKVENILIETGSDVPRVRLIDFGLSCVFNRGSSYNVFYGTIDRNSPPEWYYSHTYTAGPTTVWQVGVVLYEMVHKYANFETSRFLMNRLRISSDLSDNCKDFLELCLTELSNYRPTLEQLKTHPWLRSPVPSPASYPASRGVPSPASCPVSSFSSRGVPPVSSPASCPASRGVLLPPVPSPPIKDLDPSFPAPSDPAACRWT